MLDADTLDGICIVAAPDLGRIIQHSRVKSSAASAASFDQHIRISLYQSFEEIIDAEYILIHDFSIVLESLYRREHIAYTAVHVHLDIFYIGSVYHCGYLFKYMIHNFFSGEVQHKLVPASHRTPAGYNIRPVRVLTVQVAVLIDHLRLDPQSELHSRAVDRVSDALERTS